MNGDQVEIVDVTITAPDVEWLRQHCAMLIDRRLAASANIIPVVESIYRWENTVQRATEAYAILHTVARHTNEIVELTKQKHPYQVAHVQATRIGPRSKPYAIWIHRMTTAD